MSYLIALYVYYHGNNLEVFGITKGARDEELSNTGLKRPDEIDASLVDRELLAGAKEMEEKEQNTRQVNEWNEIMKHAIATSQQESFKLYQSGNVENDLFKNTVDSNVVDYDEGYIPLDFFSSINGL